MALTVRVDGSVVGGQPNTATAAWWNDYHDLLTGAMTDQDLAPKADLLLAPIGAAPTAAPSATSAAGTGLGVGIYLYAVSFVKQGQFGESLPSPTASVTTTTGNQHVALSSLPLGPTGTTARRLYRTTVGGSQLKLLTTLANNTATTYTDTASDGSLGANAPGQSSFGGRLLIKDASGTVNAFILPNGAVSFDAGAITSNGAGVLSASSFQVSGQPVIVLGSGSYAGFHLFVGPNTPSGMVKGDVWLKTPF
jgi:hypothetical protein